MSELVWKWKWTEETWLERERREQEIIMIRIQNLPYCMLCKRRVDYAQATLMPSRSMRVEVSCHRRIFSFSFNYSALIDKTLFDLLQVALNNQLTGAPKRPLLVIGTGFPTPLPEPKEPEEINFDAARAIDLSEKK